LEYVELITRAAYRSTPNDVEKLRGAGPKEEQISEAVYMTAMFAFFNRVADAVGVPFSGLPHNREINLELRCFPTLVAEAPNGHQGGRSTISFWEG
jgi:hypothetical protein